MRRPCASPFHAATNVVVRGAERTGAMPSQVSSGGVGLTRPLIRRYVANELEERKREARSASRIVERSEPCPCADAPKGSCSALARLAKGGVLRSEPVRANMGASATDGATRFPELQMDD